MRWLATYWRHVPTPIRQVAVLIAGVLLVLAGIAMLVLPGPGLVVIVLGCVVLASEFVWAHHLLRRGLSMVPARWRAGIEKSLAPPKPREL